MGEKVWKLVVKRYKDETNIKKFVINAISDVIFLIGTVILVMLFKIIVF